MKKRYIGAMVAVLAGVPALAACGGTGEAEKETTTQQVTSEEATSESETTQTTAAADATTTSEAKAPGNVHPYAWMGLQDMPECNYLDIISTGKYYEVSENHALGLVAEQIEASEGSNTYKESSGTKTYSVDGRIVSINETAKNYTEIDMGSAAQTAKEQMDDAMATGRNVQGRSFKESGKGAVPVLSEGGDATEYEYYEYNYPESSDIAEITERFYMKDGDVYAVYQLSEMGDTKLEVVKVIKSISGDIPEGTFEIPDLSGYEKL